jgi:hypothetical protein
MREDIDSFLIELNSNGGDPKKTYLAHNGSSDEE